MRPGTSTWLGSRGRGNWRRTIPLWDGSHHYGFDGQADARQTARNLVAMRRAKSKLGHYRSAGSATNEALRSSRTWRRPCLRRQHHLLLGSRETRGVRKAELDRAVGPWIESALARPGVSLLHLNPRIAVESTQLPQPFHRDPADQLLVAAARVLQVFQALPARPPCMTLAVVNGHHSLETPSTETTKADSRQLGGLLCRATRFSRRA